MRTPATTASVDHDRPVRRRTAPTSRPSTRRTGTAISSQALPSNCPPEKAKAARAKMAGANALISPSTAAAMAGTGGVRLTDAEVGCTGGA
ncbi:hypothetical protein [Blastococcus brunescens]|uniref:Uncharacterized protein n=1 Tax=Blastococcus brunescens TaxID=1564165 RepID=A0ABZ1B5P4_9ACTN|nr:hypothetical protein [Blastococcus sp. BMG 8361]WRL66132.1 hypothetical protein U6N30_11840 [Blastococcus sp. BMG 8361]